MTASQHTLKKPIKVTRPGAKTPRVQRDVHTTADVKADNPYRAAMAVLGGAPRRRKE